MTEIPVIILDVHNVPVFWIFTNFWQNSYYMYSELNNDITYLSWAPELYLYLTLFSLASISSNIIFPEIYFWYV